MNKIKLIKYFSFVILYAFLSCEGNNNINIDSTNKIQPQYIKDVYILTGKKNDSINIKKLLNSNHPILIFRMPDIQCHQCKFLEFENIKEVFGHLSSEFVVVICTIHSLRDICYFQSSYKYKFKYYGTYKNYLVDP